ncbi:MAG: hypothetical protein U1E59_17345 [Amaricoccus sp.]
MPNYANEWAKAWSDYSNYAAKQPKDHPSKNVVAQVDGLKLTEDLQGLTYLYDAVDAFIAQAHQAKQHHPPDPDAETALNAKESQLCQRNMVQPYYERGLSAQRGLKSTVEAAKVRIQQKKPDSSEVMLLGILVKDAEDISRALTKDMETYVTKMPETAKRLRQKA